MRLRERGPAVGTVAVFDGDLDSCLEEVGLRWMVGRLMKTG